MSSFWSNFKSWVSCDLVVELGLDGPFGLLLLLMVGLKGCFTELLQYLDLTGCLDSVEFVLGDTGFLLRTVLLRGELFGVIDFLAVLLLEWYEWTESPPDIFDLVFFFLSIRTVFVNTGQYEWFVDWGIISPVCFVIMCQFEYFEPWKKKKKNKLDS